VFVSSHLLAEIEHTCDRVAILHRGRCVRTGRVADLLAAERGSSILVAVEDLAGARGVLADAGIAAAVDGGRLRVALSASEAARVSRTLGERGHWVTELRADERDLEDVFLELTTEPAPDRDPGPESIATELEGVV
jgi:ABC-2 type transport system ATP-binding protein